MFQQFQVQEKGWNDHIVNDKRFRDDSNKSEEKRFHFLERSQLQIASV